MRDNAIHKFAADLACLPLQLLLPVRSIGVSVTVKDVARAAGVSTATVSRVLNQSAIVTEATRASDYSAVSYLGYRQNIHAMYLSRERCKRNEVDGLDELCQTNGNPAGAAMPSESGNQVLGVEVLRILVQKCEALSC